MKDQNSDKRRFVYVIWYAPARAVKIGVTNTGHRRVREVMAALPPGESSLLFVLPNRGFLTETLLHKHFSPYHESGEWFSPVGSLREWLVRRTAPDVLARLDLPPNMESHTQSSARFMEQCRAVLLGAMAKLDPGAYPTEFMEMAGILAKVYGARTTVFEIDGHKLRRLKDAAA